MIDVEMETNGNLLDQLNLIEDSGELSRMPPRPTSPSNRSNLEEGKPGKGICAESTVEVMLTQWRLRSSPFHQEESCKNIQRWRRFSLRHFLPTVVILSLGNPFNYCTGTSSFALMVRDLLQVTWMEADVFPVCR